MGKGRTPCCEKGRVKKGPWSQDEDLKLISFIHRHGHSNWRSLPKLAGLARCGKSCRLRWVNYLRPDVRRGSLTTDEEETIIKLQSLIGNKWSKIASHLPGRTDNEIKNIWNTHLKRRLSDKKSDKAFTNSAQRNQDKVSNELSSYVQINGQGGPTCPSVTPTDDGTIEFSSSDCTTHDSSHDPIDVTRQISYADEPNLVDLWESLLLDAGSQYDQMNPNIHYSTGKQSPYAVPKVDNLVSKKDMQARGNSVCPFGLLNNFELGKINEEAITATNYGGYQQIVDEQLEAISNDGLLKMDSNMGSYFLETTAWPSSPTCYSFSGY